MCGNRKVNLEEAVKVDLPISSTSKSAIRKWIEQLAGGEKPLTIEKLREHRECLQLLLGCMKSEYHYRNANDPLKKYYDECWTRIERATTEEEEVAAIEYLRYSIQWD